MNARHTSRHSTGAPFDQSLLGARENHWTVFKGLLPYVWPASRPDLKRNVVLAFVALLVAKLVTVATPIIYKEAVDALTRLSIDDPGSAKTLTLLITGLVLAYGLARVIMMGLNQVRDVFFTKVGQHAV